MPSLVHRLRASARPMAVGALVLAMPASQGLGPSGEPLDADSVRTVGYVGPAIAVDEADDLPAYDGRTVADPVRLVGRGEAALRVSPKGTQLWSISATSGHDLPVAAERAYRAAERTMARQDPGCELPWWLLAGVGRVETDHGRYPSSELGADGVSRPLIRGLVLDGAGPVAAIRDSDDGRLDGNRVWDRAVGPMQFIPTTWALVASDGDGDGRADPDDLDDAALAAAKYLCMTPGSLSGEAAQRAAIFRYNQSDYYVDLVRAFAVGYHTGVFDIPPPPVVEVEADEEAAPPRRRAPRVVAVRDTAPTGGSRTPVSASPPAGGSTTDGSGGSTPPPPRPKPALTPAPAPTPPPPPAPPADETITGVLTRDGTAWFVGGRQVSFGNDARLAQQATADYDGDGVAETNGVELQGLELLGQPVTIVINGGTIDVIAINAKPY